MHSVGRSGESVAIYQVEVCEDSITVKERDVFPGDDATPTLLSE